MSSGSGRARRRRCCSTAVFWCITCWRCGRCGSGAPCACNAGELAQLALGFAVPILLAHHVAATRISDDYFGTYDLYYTFFLWVYFVHAPARGVLQLVTLVVAWTHAMFGLHYLAPGQAVVCPAAARGAGRCGAGPGAVAARRDRGRAPGRRPRRRSRLDRGGLCPYAAALALGRARARPDRRRSRLVLCRHGRRGIAGAAGAPAVAAPPRAGADRLSRRPFHQCHPRHQRARGEPARRHPARPCLRRARPLLDLPGAGARRSRQPRSPRRDRAAGAGAASAPPPMCAWPASCGQRARSR